MSWTESAEGHEGNISFGDMEEAIWQCMLGYGVQIVKEGLTGRDSVSCCFVLEAQLPAACESGLLRL